MKYFLLVFSIYSLVHSEITSQGKLYSTLCIEEQSIGFKWTNNNWVNVNYKPTKYIIKKIANDETYCKPNEKIHESESDKKRKISLKWVDSCYSLNEFGEEDFLESKKTCGELWIRTTLNGKYTLDKVSCNGAGVHGDFIFNPSGEFNHSDMEFLIRKDFKGGKRDKRDKRDSSILSHGKCSKL